MKLTVRIGAVAACMALALCVFTACGSSSSSSDKAPAWAGGPYPIPQNEVGLTTVVAEEYVHVSDNPASFLEGLFVDKEGNLYMTSCLENKFYVVSADGKTIESYDTPITTTSSMNMDKEGNLYFCGLGDFQSGEIVKCDAKGENAVDIIPRSEGYMIDELQWRNDGQFYFTKYAGNAGNTIGGVYLCNADGSDIRPVAEGLAMPNGLALNDEQDRLYVTEMGTNRLLLFELDEEGFSTPTGGSVPYYFTGAPGCDSITIDADGNVYAAMFKQGRIIVLDKNGMPLMNIVMPGREEGKNMWVTNCTFLPGTDQLIICCSDMGEGGLNLFTVKGLAKGANEFMLQ